MLYFFNQEKTFIKLVTCCCIFDDFIEFNVFPNLVPEYLIHKPLVSALQCLEHSFKPGYIQS